MNNRRTRCKQCGSSDLKISYIKKRDRLHVMAPCFGFDNCPKGEHMHQRCNTCGYKWWFECGEWDDKDPIKEKEDGYQTKEA